MKEILVRPTILAWYNNKQFDVHNKKLNINNALDAMYELREDLKKRDYILKTIDTGDLIKSKAIIFADIEHIDPYLKKCVKLGLKDKMILIMTESPLIKPHQYTKRNHDKFKYILTWSDDLIDNKKYFRYYIPQILFKTPKKKVPFNKKRFMCMVNANKIAIGEGELYSERKKASLFLEKKIKDYDVYGMEWNKNQFKLITFLHTIKNFHKLNLKRALYLIDYIFNIRKLKSYKGPVESVTETMSKYKFCLCYENADNYRGYVTEKIFNCFNARCVPIYWGAPNITDYVPANTFIDRKKFRSDDELLQFLKDMKEKEYEKYIKNINRFLKSEKADKFSIDHFKRIMNKIL